MGEKAAPTVHRELSREVFPDGKRGFLPLGPGFLCFEQLARTLINSGPKSEVVGGHAREVQLFAAGPGQNQRAAFAGQDC